jgi:hypothetical protein
MYKSDKVAVRDVVNNVINRREARKRKAPTTAEKFNSKYSDQRTGGQRLGSFLFAWLGSLLEEHTHLVKSSNSKPNGQNGYSSVSC